jgi:YhcH/YjgK/YiaL family protein
MIIDTLPHASTYFGLNPFIEEAFTWIRSQDLAKLPDGRIDLHGDEAYALVQSYQTKPATEKRWEAHRKYIDLQYLVSGGEWFGYAPLDTLVTVEPYAPDKDATLLEGSGKFMRLAPGEFAIVFPQDAHLPGVCLDLPEQVKKLVFKLAYEPIPA